MAKGLSVEKIIYVLCALTAALCAWLLLRTYLRNKIRLLFWSGLCFSGLALNNVILLLDKTVFSTTADLLLLRSSSALIALLLLLFGLIWEEQ